MIKSLKFLLSIHCMTYNHAPYIEDAMNGFCMQETSFPFLAIICDDASTDGEQDVIRKYLQEHFNTSSDKDYQSRETEEAKIVFAQHKTNSNCSFLVIFLKTNYYSQKKDKSHLWKEWEESAKYIALCEGDDYWTDPQKLQKQVDFLESHSDYSMVCNRAKKYSEMQGHFISDMACGEQDNTLSPKRIITKGGLFISTCSIVYKKEVKNKYPEYCIKCHVGDYPLQIMCAMKGRCYYLNKAMCVYRVDNPQAWTKTFYKQPISKRIDGIISEVSMLKGFSNDYSRYHTVFRSRMAYYIIHQFSPQNFDDTRNQILASTFANEIKNFSIFWKIYFRMYLYQNKYIRYIYFKLITPYISRF